MTIELINEMEATLRQSRPDLYQQLVRSGVFTSKMLFHREVFLYFDKEKRIGNKTVRAVDKTARQFNITESTVYYAMRNMKK